MKLKKEFTLDTRIEKDTFLIAEDSHLKYLLMNNAHLPWIIVVPKQADVQNFIDLEPHLKLILVEKIDIIAKIIQENFSPDRVNIGMLGNIVTQMHWHIVARFEHDICWPKPVWGNLPSRKYENDQAEAMLQKLKKEFEIKLQLISLEG